MITIKKAMNADSRTANFNLTVDDLTADTKSHMDDVNNGMKFIAEQIIHRGRMHDNTKLNSMNQFYDAIKSNNIKNTFWYQMHIVSERHHLKSNVPDDVNLIDVIEHLVDCTMAGLTRSGSIYDTDLSPEILEKAVANTVKLLKDNTKVEE